MKPIIENVMVSAALVESYVQLILPIKDKSINRTKEIMIDPPI